MRPVPLLARQALAELWSSSTSFANPMIDVARTMSDTFAGIAPVSVPMLVVMQLAGAAAAAAVVHVLYPSLTDTGSDVVVPHGPRDSLQEPA